MGIGAEMLKVLRQGDFPISELRVLARSERDEEIAGGTVLVTIAPSTFVTASQSKNGRG